MAQRLATLLLAATIAFAGVTVCPRGALSCMMMQQANHTCCGNQLSLRAHNCCGQRASSHVLNTATGHADREFFKSITVSLCAANLDTVSGQDCRRLIHTAGGPAPPDTPFSQHTQLLL
jgi:hypothetical protein